MTPDGIEALYRAHAPMLFRVCLRYTRSRADAEDLVHAAFAKALAAGDGFRGDSAAFTWLYRIAVNEALQFLRRRRSRPEAPALLEEELDAAADADDPALRVTVRQLLDRCDAETQEIAVLHYLEGMTQEETAAATGAPLRTVELRLSRFRAQARKWLTKENA